MYFLISPSSQPPPWGFAQRRKRQHRNKPDGEPQQGDGHSTFCKKKLSGTLLSAPCGV